jgi:hypothetical protein
MVFDISRGAAMPVKIFLSTILVATIWWSVSRKDDNLQATADRVKPTPSTITVAQNSASSANQIIGATPGVGKVPSSASPNPSTPASSIAPSPIVLRPRSLPIDKVTDQILNGLMSSIISQESSGKSNLQHPVSKAVGLGQVLPSNIPTWTKETFGQELTTEQFLNSPDAQFYTIRYKLFDYYQRAILASSGDLYLAVRRVGSQWYSGQADLYESTQPVATGPSIRDYTMQVLSRFQNFYPQNYIVRYR